MRIISNFKDYYDNAISSFGHDAIDPKLIYVRKTESIILKPTYSSATRLHSHSHYCGDCYNEILNAASDISQNFFIGHAGAIAFCGNIYPFYNVCFDVAINSLNCASLREYSNENSAITFYSFDSILEFVAGNKLVNFFNNKYTNFKNKELVVNDSVKQIRLLVDKNYFNQHQKMFNKYSLQKLYELEAKYKNQKSNDDLFIKHNSPILSTVWLGSNKIELVVNPRLNQYNFAIKFDTYTAFQEIAMYIGSNLAKQTDPTTNFSDELKCEIAGFDTKTSFRGKNK